MLSSGAAVRRKYFGIELWHGVKKKAPNPVHCANELSRRFPNTTWCRSRRAVQKSLVSVQLAIRCCTASFLTGRLHEKSTRLKRCAETRRFNVIWPGYASSQIDAFRFAPAITDTRSSL